MSTDALVVGYRLQTADDYDRLPVGAVIAPRSSRRKADQFTKTVEGWRSERYQNIYQVSDLDLGGYNKVVSMPEVGAQLESLVQWQFRFYDNALQSAEQAGVHREVVTRACDELGIGDETFPIGAGVTMKSEYQKSRVPEGALVVRGEPEHLTTFGLFAKRNGRWTTVLGGSAGHSGYPVTVVSGAVVPWATTPGTADEQEALRAFKAQAWKVGWKVKTNHRWCESYEAYMARIGLDESALRGVAYGGISVGDKVNRSQAAILPAGSVLRWVHSADPDTFTWFIRDDAITTLTSRTRVLFGHRSDGTPLRNAASVMEVLGINTDGDLNIPIDNFVERVAGHLPVGTVLLALGTEYVVCADHRVASGRSPRETGTWALNALTRPAIVRFP